MTLSSALCDARSSPTVEAIAMRPHIYNSNSRSCRVFWRGIVESSAQAR